LALNGCYSYQELPRSPRGPVTPQTQPALYAVVEVVAGRLGVSVPDRVWLMSFGPAVRLFPDGRRPMDPEAVRELISPTLVA
jgi:hypothetical protein